MRALSGPNREMLCKRGVMRALRVRDWETALGLKLMFSAASSSSAPGSGPWGNRVRDWETALGLKLVYFSAASSSAPGSGP